MTPFTSLEPQKIAAVTDVANEDSFVEEHVLTKVSLPSQGWDPFEIWRTRVHLEQKRLGLAYPGVD
jgi:hypothetical protein